MREFSITIEKEIGRGLRPEVRATRGSGYLIECRNLMCGEYGLENVVIPTDPFLGQLVNYPHPQIVRWPRHTYLLGETTISEVSTSAVPWVASLLTTYDAFSPLQEKDPLPGGVWHLAQFQDSFYLFNGSSVIFRTGLDKLVSQPVKTYVQDQVTIKTGCEFKGRIITGGFDPANIWNSEWATRFADWAAQLDEPFSNAFSDIGQNWVMWSSIGGGDFPLWLFYPNEGYEYTLEADELLEERILRNEFGWMPMPFSGMVQAIFPLERNVVVYGENGIAVLTQVSGGGDVPPTFGAEQILDVGISQRGCVAGNRNQHFFIDSRGDLWIIEKNLSLRKLGYREYLAPLLGEDVRMSYISQGPYLYISSDSYSFILSNYGLTEHNRSVTSAYLVDGGVIGLSKAQTGDAAELVTNEFDMSSRSIKTVTQVLVNAKAAGLVEVCVYFRYDKGPGWTQGPWMELNKEGVARVQESGTDFRIGIRSAVALDFVIDYIQVSYQLSDRRYQRGPYVDSDAAGPGGRGLGLL